MKRIFTVFLVVLMISFIGGVKLNAQNNTPPSCVITYPHSNAYYQVGTDMTIRVYSTGIGGTNADRSINKVEFFVDGVKVDETANGTSDTYSFLWENVEAGNYRITARATDDLGETFTSAGVLVSVGEDPVVKRGISADKGKYLGNIIGYTGVKNNFTQYWNGVTAENSAKWGSIEGTRDDMQWGGADDVYDYAYHHNLMYRYHAVAWGNQYPLWLEDLSSDVTAFRAEIEEYMAEMAARYEYIDQIDVLNENMYLNTYNEEEHAPGTPYFREGLGGPGETGYDWAIWLFEKAREYFPNSKLVINDYELENNPDGIREMLNLVEVLRDRGLIDGFGTQAHHFNVDALASNPGTLESNIDLMASSGVPVYVTELDLRGGGNDEASQLYSYQQLFPVYWEHPAVAGVTLWGYVEGETWADGTGLFNADGTKKDAMIWLENYMAGQPDVGYPHSGVELEENHDLLVNGEFNQGITGWTIQENSGASATMEAVTEAGMSGDNALKVCPDPDNFGDENWHIQVRQEAPIIEGRSYDISFSAKADAERPLDLAVQMDDGGYTTHFGESMNLTTETREFNYTFTADVTDESSKLKFYIGNNAGCVYIDNVKFIDLDPYLSVSDSPEFSKTQLFGVYPNPFNNELFIDFNGENAMRTSYQIVNINGQVVAQGSLDNNARISTNHLASGVYFIKLENDDITEIKKIIKN